MPISQYCHFDDTELENSLLTTHLDMQLHALELVTSTRQLSDIQAAKTLKRYGLSPGDIVKHPYLLHVRIEDSSKEGSPMGTTLTSKGIEYGERFKLYDKFLINATKV